MLESGVFAWRNTNRQSVIVAEGDAARLLEIASACDVILDARPGAGGDPGPNSHVALRTAFPDLNIVAISWFGQDGPYRDFVGAAAGARTGSIPSFR